MNSGVSNYDQINCDLNFVIFNFVNEPASLPRATQLPMCGPVPVVVRPLFCLFGGFIYDIALFINSVGDLCNSIYLQLACQIAANVSSQQ